jgi:hypothetical protein
VIAALELPAESFADTVYDVTGGPTHGKVKMPAGSAAVTV